MNKELEEVPIDKVKKYELMVIGEEGSSMLRASKDNQLPTLADGSLVISSELHLPDHLKSYRFSTFSMDDVAAGNVFDPYDGFIQMLYRNALERMQQKDWQPKPKKSNYFGGLVHGFEEELAMSLMEPRMLERMASLSRSANITTEIVIQTVDNLKRVYTYEVKAPIADKKRFRLWLRLVFKEKGRKKLVLTNQKELSVHHQQLLKTALEKHKEKAFLLDEFHQFGGAKNE